MRAPVFGAGGGEAEDFGGLQGRGHGEDVFGGRKRLVEVLEERSGAVALDDPEDPDTIHAGLGAGA